MIDNYQDAYDYYTRGGETKSNLPAAYRQRLKDLAKDWIKKLDNEF